VTLLSREHGILINRKRVRRLRQAMGLEAVWCRPRTTIPDRSHRKLPYLLRNLKIDRANQVWCTDVTDVPMPVGYAHLCAVMHWHTRKVLGWTVSNTMDTELCLSALQQAPSLTGTRPESFNTDQGSQFISEEWTGRLTELGIAIRIIGKGRWMDSVFNERLWRSVKYEEIYVKEHASLSALRTGPGDWFQRYNEWRPHAAPGDLTPCAYYARMAAAALAEAAATLHAA
jgi:putative transposase